MFRILLVSLGCTWLAQLTATAIISIPKFKDGQATVFASGASASPRGLSRIDRTGRRLDVSEKELYASFFGADPESGPIDRFSKKVDGETKYGLKQKKTGKILAEPVWSELYFGGDQNNKHCTVSLGKGKESTWGVIDLTGKVVVDVKWDGVNLRTGGPWIIEQGKEYNEKRYGLATSGKILAQPTWERTGRRFSKNGKMAVSVNGKWGYVNRLGKVVIPMQYKQAGFFGGKYAIVQDDAGHHLIDTSGKKTCKLPGEPMEEFGRYFGDSKFIPVQKDKKWGCADLTGKLVVPFEWDYISSPSHRTIFSEGLAPVDKGKKSGFINQLGKLVIPCKWDLVGEFSEGLAYVEAQGKWAFIDKTGKVKIGPVKIEKQKE